MKYDIKRCSYLECPNGWDGWIDGKSVNLGCLYFNRNIAMSWYEAKDYCKALGFEHHHDAHLVEIYDSTQETFIKETILKIGNTKSWWTGLTDIETETLWRWNNTGNIATYLNWGKNQPDGAPDPADCMALWSPFTHNWADNSCTLSNQANQNIYAICQFSY